MARYHYWQFLVNQEGQPISNANISIYLAGTNTPASVFLSEFGSNSVDTAPQVSTNSVGYFEFWLGDDQEILGYPIGQKFKLSWNKENIAAGTIDWVDIFPGFAPVDVNSTDKTRNKLVSDYLAKTWQDHQKHQDVTTTARPTFSQVTLTSDPFYDDDIVTKEYADELARGLSWQNPVNSFYDPSTGLPSSGTEGDRYISTNTANGWFEDYIYEWNTYAGDDWIETVPMSGYSLLVEDEARHYTYNGVDWVKFSAGFDWYNISSDTSLKNRNGYLVDSSGGPITLTFPPNPAIGSRIDVLDYTYNSAANNITLDGNGELIEDSSTFILDIDGAGLQFIYSGGTYGWKLLNEVYSEEYLTKLYEEFIDVTDTDSGWTADGAQYYITVTHERGTSWPAVTVYDTDTRILITPNQVKSLDSSTIRLWFDSQLNLKIKLN